MIIGIIIIIALICMLGSLYNSLVRSRNYLKESWSQIDVQLIRRSELIPNLVNTVKGIAKHEQETLERVIAARNQMASMGAGASREEIMEQSDKVSNSLKSVFILSESYPELKANQNFLALSEELTSTENKISYARQLYNSSVTSYNTKVQSFPACIFAGMLGFKEENTLIEATTEQKQSVKVEF